jgi:hypothetical protein
MSLEDSPSLDQPVDTRRESAGISEPDGCGIGVVTKSRSARSRETLSTAAVGDFPSRCQIASRSFRPS